MIKSPHWPGVGKYLGLLIDKSAYQYDGCIIDCILHFGFGRVTEEQFLESYNDDFTFIESNQIL